MKKLFTQYKFNNANCSDFLPLRCYCCDNIFYLRKSKIKYFIKYLPNNGKYCSKKCFILTKKNSSKIKCVHCQQEFYRTIGQLKKSKNHFCNRSCAATYRNLHKTTGIRRSKLEKWLEQQLSELYPNLKILYNDKSIINSELDIYIPFLKLAVEINGIFHYEPIFGESKLQQIKNNDQRKHQACYEHGIEIIWIDTSNMKYFKPRNAQPYLDIIIKILTKKIKKINA